MERAKAWELFCQEMQPAISGSRQDFLKLLSERCGDLKKAILNMMNEALDLMKSRNKEEAVYFYFSLLKVDIIQHRYTLALQVMDDHWYLDQEVIEVYGDLEFLFQPLDQLFTDLNRKRRVFVNKIDEYDLQGLLFDELAVYSSTIAHYLRYLLRDVGQEDVFISMINGHYPEDGGWVIRWGEYDSDTELIIQQDLQPKTEKEWKRSLIQTEETPEWLSCSYWYQLDVLNFNCSRKDMLFICFDRCCLKEITFDHCVMVGSRFLQTQLINCSFVSADLRDADFSGCKGVQLDFTDANVTGALFSKEVIEGSNLTEEQILTAFVREEYLPQTQTMNGGVK